MPAAGRPYSKGLAPIIGIGRYFSAALEELRALMEMLEVDVCLPVLMNVRVFGPLYEIVKADAGRGRTPNARAVQRNVGS